MHVLGLPLALMRLQDKSDIVHVSLTTPLLVSLNINMQCKLVGNSQLRTMHESTEAHGAATEKKKLKILKFQKYSKFIKNMKY
jgi:hypothetical protein